MEGHTRLRCIVCTVLAYFISALVDFDMSTNRVLPIAPMLVGAISGTMSIFLFSYYISKNTKWLSTVLRSIGQETMLFVAFSQAIIMVLNYHYSMNPIA